MHTSPTLYRHGATHLGERRTRFRVWAPDASEVSLHLLRPIRAVVAMERRGDGYWEVLAEHAPPGARYLYQVDGSQLRPDPASRSQPESVHEASEVVSAEFEWDDERWRGLPMERCILYEIHVGTYTPEGTFDAIHEHLPYLRDLGITFIELMPVAQFPGSRNWGYDGVYPFAVQNSYGGPQGLKRLVNECHKRGLGVVLDVVYNHLGPEGNYLAEFAPYFTGRYRTPWGQAINFDDLSSDEVRRFFIENALYWLRELHIDGLRLDAVHGIFDRSAYPFLEELTDTIQLEASKLNRQVLVIAESDLNDPRVIRSKDLGGFGMDAQWADEFHHALRTLLSGDRSGYYQDFGELRDLAKAYREGYVHTGQFSSFRRRRHGASTTGIPPWKFVVFSQNHDQVGNRMFGERLGSVVSFEDLKLAAAAVILSPHIPLLFMGEEYGETAPFLYFVSHSDPELVNAVRQGRKEEFAAFAWQGEPPDPQAEETFQRSKLSRELRFQGKHGTLRLFYRQLLHLRREVPALELLSSENMWIAFDDETRVLVVRRWHDHDEVLLALCFSETEVRVKLPMPRGRWSKLLDSADATWLGPAAEFNDSVESGGSLFVVMHPRSAVLYRRSMEI